MQGMRSDCFVCYGKINKAQQIKMKHVMEGQPINKYTSVEAILEDAQKIEDPSLAAEWETVLNWDIELHNGTTWLTDGHRSTALPPGSWKKYQSGSANAFAHYLIEEWCTQTYGFVVPLLGIQTSAEREQ